MLSGFKCLIGRRPRRLLLKIGFPILLILLLFIFRGVVAVPIPLSGMISSIVIALGGVRLVMAAVLGRALLVPSPMALFGQDNWWSPGPLRRLHLWLPSCLHETEAARGRRRLCRASRGQAGAAW